jgi:hypothetical protein
MYKVLTSFSEAANCPSFSYGAILKLSTRHDTYAEALREAKDMSCMGIALVVNSLDGSFTYVYHSGYTYRI